MVGRLAALLFLLTASCTRTGVVETIKLGHGLDTNHPVHHAMVFMQERLDSLSGGVLQIQIYPSQQLGTERQLLELLQLGSLGMTKVASAVLEGFAPEYKVLSLPYIFRSEAHRYDVLADPLDVGFCCPANSTGYADLPTMTPEVGASTQKTDRFTHPKILKDLRSVRLKAQPRLEW